MTAPDQNASVEFGRSLDPYEVEQNSHPILLPAKSSFKSPGNTPFSVQVRRGDLDSFAHITPEACMALLQAVSDAPSLFGQDRWTQSSLLRHLRWTFVRALEQGHLVYLQHSSAELQSRGLSEHFCLLNTGLLCARDQPSFHAGEGGVGDLWLCFTQYPLISKLPSSSTSFPQYILTPSGLLSGRSSLAKIICCLLKQALAAGGSNLPSDIVALRGKFNRAGLPVSPSFPSPTVDSLVFDARLPLNLSLRSLLLRDTFLLARLGFVPCDELFTLSQKFIDTYLLSRSGDERTDDENSTRTPDVAHSLGAGPSVLPPYSVGLRENVYSVLDRLAEAGGQRTSTERKGPLRQSLLQDQSASTPAASLIEQLLRRGIHGSDVRGQVAELLRGVAVPPAAHSTNEAKSRAERWVKQVVWEPLPWTSHETSGPQCVARAVWSDNTDSYVFSRGSMGVEACSASLEKAVNRAVRALRGSLYAVRAGWCYRKVKLTIGAPEDGISKVVYRGGTQLLVPVPSPRSNNDANRAGARGDMVLLALQCEYDPDSGRATRYRVSEVVSQGKAFTQMRLLSRDIPNYMQ